MQHLLHVEELNNRTDYSTTGSEMFDLRCLHIVRESGSLWLVFTIVGPLRFLLELRCPLHWGLLKRVLVISTSDKPSLIPRPCRGGKVLFPPPTRTWLGYEANPDIQCKVFHAGVLIGSSPLVFDSPFSYAY